MEAEGQSAHGSTPEKGVNAIGRLLLALKKLGLDGDSGQAAAFLADVLGEETRGEGLGIAMSDQISGALTVNLGIIRGGGEELSLTLDLRWPVTARYEDFADRLMGSHGAGRLCRGAHRGAGQHLHAPGEPAGPGAVQGVPGADRAGGGAALHRGAAPTPRHVPTWWPSGPCSPDRR